MRVVEPVPPVVDQREPTQKRGALGQEVDGLERVDLRIVEIAFVEIGAGGRVVEGRELLLVERLNRPIDDPLGQGRPTRD